MTEINDVSTNDMDFKRLDTTRDIVITPKNVFGNPVQLNTSHTWTAKVSDETNYVGNYPATINPTRIIVNSADFTKLPAGQYHLEVWEEWTDANGDSQRSIYPSPKETIPFRIYSNVTDLAEKEIKTIGFQDVVDQAVMNIGMNYVFKVNTIEPDQTATVVQAAADGKNYVTFNIPRGDKGDKGDVGPAGPKGDKGDTGLQGPVGHAGGRNLLLGSRLLTINNLSSHAATVEVVPFDSKTNMCHITSPQGGDWFAGIYFLQSENVTDPVTSGAKWAFSLDIKGKGVYALSGVESSDPFNSVTGQVSSDWTRVSSTGIAKGTNALIIYFNAYNSPLDVYIKLPKLEVGNIATDWTPAPEDYLATNSQVTQLSDSIQTKVSSSDFDNLSKSVEVQKLDSADINNMRTNGHYFVHNLANNPIGGWVYVDVVGNVEGRIRQDVYQDIGNQHCYRRWNDSCWTDWSKDATESEITKLSDSINTNYAKIQAAIVALGGSLK